MDWQQGNDYSTDGRSTRRATSAYRAAFNATYAVGGLVKIADQLTQVWSDGATVVPVTATGQNRNIQGLVSEDWKGLDGTLGTNAATSATLTGFSALGRGTQILKVTTWGYHPLALIDNLNGSAAIVNEAPLINSTSTAGSLMEITPAVTSISAIVGCAVLPASGIGSSLGNSTLAPATQTFTIAGTPTVNDVYTVNVQTPYAGTPFNLPYTPGVAVSTAYVIPALSAAQATNVTTAAAAVVAYLNGVASFAKYYLASNAAGVITITVVPAQFFVTTTNGNFFYITTAGTVGNSLTCSCSVVGVSTFTAGGATFTGGTGYKGTCPVWLELAK